jgi:hypothetical protein
MIQPPPYFDAIRRDAERRWQQLEDDPDLAAPWRQLFRQVQSPRHVLSELLQNADDAGATAAEVDLSGADFVFSHNGADFTAEDFASLCRFGYSNKRALHTIGFRGIGFKSTFSLGNSVTIATPTLSVAFDHQRFTLPVWIDRDSLPVRQTIVRAPIADEHRRREIEKNLWEWQRSAPSLLFFRNLRRLTILGFDISWEREGDGPVSNAEWMVLPGDPPTRVLVIRSGLEDFPSEALDEIRSERMILAGDEPSFPPSRVEIVLGTEGRLFVVLPTGVKTDLPFAANAPFVQDPARLKIKDPDVSPTNRWLLARIGNLAASAMQEWLRDESLTSPDRAAAYDLLVDTSLDEGSLERSCATHIEDAFHDAAQSRDVLLTEDDRLVGRWGCVVFPPGVFEIWSAAEISKTLNGGLPLLSHDVAETAVTSLVRCKYVLRRSSEEVASTLGEVSPPKPRTWRQLLHLWSFIAAEVSRYRYFRNRCPARVVPVQGSDVLHAIGDVVRIGEKKLLQSDDDWTFLSRHLQVLNQNWTRYLTEQRRLAETGGDHVLGKLVGDADRVLQDLGLVETSDTGDIFKKVCAGLNQENATAEDWVRAAHIAAALSAAIPETFRYLTRDGRTTAVSKGLIIDRDGTLADLVDPEWHREHALDDVYLTSPSSCTEDEWWTWIASEKSRVQGFVPLESQRTWVWGREKVRAFLRERGAAADPQFRYVTHQFFIEDWDFDEDHWTFWTGAARGDAMFWGRLFTRFLNGKQRQWLSATSARVLQQATSGTLASITSEPLVPMWIDRFRSLPCLPDTWGKVRLPHELLRRTPATESLLDIEPFVGGELDVEATRPLLKLLGVRETPTSAAALLDRLRALSRSPVLRVSDIEKLYRRLDSLLAHAPTSEVDQARQAFASENLIFTETEEWGSSSAVFLSSDEDDVPGAAVVHRSFRDLSLWHRIDVAPRPSVELAVEWLKNLDHAKLDSDELRRARLLLQRHPNRIWEGCRRWLTIDGEWVPVDSLRYALTMQSLVPWKHLFPHVRQTVADFQKLPMDVLQHPPFATLPTLGESIAESECTSDAISRSRKEWISSLGEVLARLQVDDADDCERLRGLGRRLSRTEQVIVRQIESTPTINGVPVGTPRLLDALWKGEVLYVVASSAPKTARAITHAIASQFSSEDITDAVKICYEREPHFIDEYALENFELATVESMPERGTTTPVTTADELATDTQRHGSGGETFEDPISDDAETTHDDSGHRIHRPKRAPLIERFARTLGYERVSAERIERRDGLTLTPDEDSPSVWNAISADGEFVQSYWPREHYLDEKPLVIPADIWSAFERHPDRWTLVLVDGNHRPLAIRAVQLMDWVRSGRASIHVADYRVSISSPGALVTNNPTERQIVLETK